jgi:hypothetical protein
MKPTPPFCERQFLLVGWISVTHFFILLTGPLTESFGLAKLSWK